MMWTELRDVVMLSLLSVAVMWIAMVTPEPLSVLLSILWILLLVFIAGERRNSLLYRVTAGVFITPHAFQCFLILLKGA